MIVTLVAVVALGYPDSLGDTKEWKDFAKVLASHDAWAVSLVLQGDRFETTDTMNGRGLWIARRKDGLLVVNEQFNHFAWDGKKGVYLDLIKKTWKPLANLDNVDTIADYVCLPGKNKGAPGGRMRRLTRSSQAGKVEEVGWEMQSGGRDYSYRSTYWFNLKTHLLTELSDSADGMVGHPGAFLSRYIWWEFDKKIPVSVWSFDAPADYKRAD